jgi:hypothetical protein
MEKCVPVREIRKFLTPKRNIDVVRVYYCYQIGSTYLQLGLMETTIVHAMAMCDRIRLSKVLQDDAPAFQHIVERHAQLQSSTLGNLIGILSKHGIGEADLGYLKWVKEKRDFFVHRFFHDEPWPGNLPERALRILCRRLLYLDHIFRRAGNQIWKIFARAELMARIDLGEDGAVIMNVDLHPNEPEWIREHAIDMVRHRARTRRSEVE